jgi:hypothetical protein
LLIADLNSALSISFLQPLAQAKSPVNASARAILSRIPIHLKDLDAGKGLKRLRPAEDSKMGKDRPGSRKRGRTQ